MLFFDKNGNIDRKRSDPTVFPDRSDTAFTFDGMTEIIGDSTRKPYYSRNPVSFGSFYRSLEDTYNYHHGHYSLIDSFDTQEKAHRTTEAANKKESETIQHKGDGWIRLDRIEVEDRYMIRRDGNNFDIATGCKWNWKWESTEKNIPDVFIIVYEGKLVIDLK